MKFKFLSLIILSLIILLSFSNINAMENINLAVVNFYCQESTSGKEWLGNGFAETLTERLSRLDNINVIQREAQRPVFNEMGLDINKKFDPGLNQTLGETLGVDYLISGALEENNSQLNIKFQLFDVNDGTIVAEEMLSGDMEKVFDLQAELALKVSEYFAPDISEEDKNELYFMPTQNMESFEKFSAGLQLYEANRIDEAYNFFYASVKGDTVFLDAHRYFEYTARKMGKLDEFIASYESMLSEEPENPILMNYLGNAYLDKGDLKKAEELYKKAIQIAPSFGNPHNNLATIYAFTGFFEKALIEYEKGLKYSDRKAPVFYNMGLCYMNMGEKEKAKEYFSKALEIDPKNPDFVAARYYLYGFKVLVTYREKKIPGDTFGEVLLNWEPLFEIQVSAGGFSPVERAKIIAGRLQTMIDGGLKPYEINLGKMNNLVVIQTNKGQLIMTFTKEIAQREGTTPEKLAEHKMEILKDIINSATSVSYTSGGYVLQGAGNKEEIKEMQGMSQEGDYLHRGDEFYSEGKLDKAKEEYEKALEINSLFAPAHFCLGMISFEKNDFEKALLSFNEAIKNNGEYIDAYIWLGKTFIAQNKKEEAKETFLKVLEIEPDNIEAQEALNKLQ